MVRKIVDYTKLAGYSTIALLSIGIGAGLGHLFTDYLTNPSRPKVQRLETKLTPKLQPQITSTKPSPKQETLERQVLTNPNLRQPPFDIDSIRVGAYSKDSPINVFTDENPDNTDVPYLYLGRNSLTIGASPTDFSPSVQILPGNKYIDISDEEFLVLQTIGGKEGGKLTFERRDSEGKIPKITSKGEGYNILSGEWGVKYNEEIGKTRKGPIMYENPYSTLARKSFPVHVVTLDKAGNRLQDWDIVIDSDGRVQAGNPDELETQEYSLRNGELTSLRLAYQKLSRQEKEDLRNTILGKTVPIQTPETIPTPAPNTQTITNNWEFNSNPRDNTNVQSDHYIPSHQSFPRPPNFLRSKTKATYNGEVYKRVPGTNKYVSPSGKFFLVD